MINCSECGAFIGHDSSNLPEMCKSCKEYDVERAKIARSNAIGMGLIEPEGLVEG